MHETLDSLMAQLKSPPVRDLAWCLFCPSIVSPTGIDTAIFQLPIDDDKVNWLLQLEKNAEPLKQWMQECPSPRLGIRFEHFWHYYWTFYVTKAAHKHYRHNLQIHKAGQTLGELDVVHYDESNNRLHHQELAVKFYLGLTPELTKQQALDLDSQPVWLGPNANDRLDLKLAQLTNKQLLMLEEPSNREVLPKEWHYDQIDVSLIIKGRLFYPLDYQAITDALLHTEHQRAVWMTCKQVKSGGLQRRPNSHHTDIDDEAYLILQRLQWFAPLLVEDETQLVTKLLDAKGLQEVSEKHFLTAGRPLVVAAFNRKSNSKRLIERERFFIVHDQWPEVH